MRMSKQKTVQHIVDMVLSALFITSMILSVLRAVPDLQNAKNMIQSGQSGVDIFGSKADYFLLWVRLLFALLLEGFAFFHVRYLCSNRENKRLTILNGIMTAFSICLIILLVCIDYRLSTTLWWGLLFAVCLAALLICWICVLANVPRDYCIGMLLCVYIVVQILPICIAVNNYIKKDISGYGMMDMLRAVLPEVFMAAAFVCLAIYIILLYKRNRGHILLPVFFGLVAVGQIMLVMNYMIAVCNLSQSLLPIRAYLIWAAGSSAVMAIISSLSVLTSMRGLQKKYMIYLLCAAFCVQSVVTTILYFTPHIITPISYIQLVIVIFSIPVWITLAFTMKRLQVSPIGTSKNVDGVS